MPAASVSPSLGLVRRPALEREFERLYRRYLGDVYRYASYVLRDRAEAEDVTQAAFLNAFRAFQRGERPHKPRSWLLTIVHNECRRHFRSSARRPTQVALDEGLTADLPPDEDVPTPEEIRRALGELSFNQRSALVLRELEGRSYAEIAETLELSLSAVETLLFRARRALREQLEGALTCGEAELALSKQLDRRLGSDEQSALRAHLRACKECSRLARRLRAQRVALRSLGPLPLPGSLTSLFTGGGGAGGGLLAGGSLLGGGVAVKAAAVLAGSAVATGLGLGAAAAGGPSHRAVPDVAPLRQAAAPAVPGTAGPLGAASDGLATEMDTAVSSVGGAASKPLAGDGGSRRESAGRTSEAVPTGDAGASPAGEPDDGPPTASLSRDAPAQAPKLPVSPPTSTAPAVPQPSVPQPTIPTPAAPSVTVPPPQAPPPPAVPPAPSVNAPVQPPPVQPPPVQPPTVQPPTVQPPTVQPPTVQPPPVQAPSVQPPPLPTPTVQAPPVTPPPVPPPPKLP